MNDSDFTLCVFCGSSPGQSARYCEAGRRLGEEIARRGVRLLYGGARAGVMGALADAALTGGAYVTGVMPTALMARREMTHEGLSEFIEVETMAERKAVMVSGADAFCALPGGVGTLDELFEVLCLSAIGEHAKPCGVLDVDDFFSPLMRFLDEACVAGFIPKRQREAIIHETSETRLLDALQAKGECR